MNARPLAPAASIPASKLQRLIAEKLRFAQAGDANATPDLDARLLVGHVLGLDQTGLVIRADRPVGPEAVAAAMALATRRAAGEPVARITGTKGFWSFELELAPETLVPRPDTETVVEAALAWAKRGGRAGEALSILDLGTGSGAILLALLSELPEAIGTGVDIAEGAVRTARRNAARLGLGSRARFAVGDWSAPLRGRFDLVVSNPPYIPRAEMPELPLEVRRFDPDIALDGGPDGLAAYRVILANLESLLAPAGAAFVEAGAGQAVEIGRLSQALGFRSRFHKDLAEIDRVVEVRRDE